MVTKPKRLLGISTFAGGDLLGKGFELAGGKIGYAFEIEKQFAAFHAANFLHPDGTPVVEIMDVKEFIRLGKERVFKILKEKYGDYDFEIVIFGGPPCVDLSRINHQKKDKKNGSKTWLTLDLIKVLIMFNPIIAVMEEIPEFLTDADFFPLFKEACEKLNYHVRVKKMCALNYEGNSVRERVIFIFVRMDLNKLPVFPQQVPSGIKMCSEFLDIDYYWSGHFDDRVRYANEPMTTVTSSSPRWFFKNGIARKPTIEEIMWCQSLDPATYRLPKKYSYSVARKVFGNGVPTMMAYHIFKTLFDQVLELEMTPGGLWIQKQQSLLLAA